MGPDEKALEMADFLIKENNLQVDRIQLAYSIQAFVENLPN